MVVPDKKIKILKAASDCFAHYGYDKTTLDDIGKLVGLNKTSLYYYYKSKELIFSDVILLEMNEFLTAVLQKISAIKDCKDKILTYLAERLKCVQNAHNLHKLAVENIKNFRPIFNELSEKMLVKEVKSLAGILAEGIQNNEIADCDVQRVAESILTVTNAIKNKTINCVDCNLAVEIDYAAIEAEIAFTVSLMLEGLIKK